jgi:phosphoribosylaminoimidazolecarboxamide formyltransferase/IMP cyclohydrolase
MPSYVTETDADRGIETIVRICAGIHANTIVPQRAMVAVKHGNACGASYGYYEQDLIRATISGDCEAVLGAVVVCNFSINKLFLELMFRAHDSEEKKWGMLAAIVCKEISEDALEFLAKKLTERKQNCVVYVNESFDYIEMGLEKMRTEKLYRPVRGGILVQDAPVFVPRFSKDETYVLHCGDMSRYMTNDLVFAWAINSTSNSNTITIVRERQLLGNAVGQQKRVASSQLAVEKARFSVKFRNNYALDRGSQNAIAWGDSFFPYPDGIKVLQDAGIRCVVATRGSKRDENVIKFCEEKEMIFATYPDSIARGFSNH